MVVFFEELAAMGEVEAPGVSSSTERDMEMEAAEQLIQLSGCEDDGGGGSECKSTDSVKHCNAAAAGERRDKEAAAVESGATRYGRSGAEKGAAAADGSVIGGDARRRPRFRSLATIYRETTRLSDGCREEEEDGRKRKEEEESEGWCGRRGDLPSSVLRFKIAHGSR